MNEYIVTYRHPDMRRDHEHFMCLADNKKHAREQCMDANPDCEIIRCADLGPPLAPNLSYDHAHSIEVIWEALHGYRETMIPEGIDMYDRQWDDICTAMAWITEDLEAKDE